MNALLDRNAARLTPAERAAVWNGISTPRASATPAVSNRVLPALVTAGLAVVALVLLAPRTFRPATPPMAAPANPGAVAARTTPAPIANVRPRVAGTSAVTSRAVHRGTARTSAAAEALTSAVPLVTDSLRELPAATSPVTAPSAPVGAGSLEGVARESGGSGAPLAFANIVVLDTHQGTMSDENGHFVIPGVPAGSHRIRLSAIGYETVVQNVHVVAGERTPMALEAGTPKVVAMSECIEVRAERRLETKSATARRSISDQTLRPIPVDDLSRSIASRAGVVAPGGELHFRGGRGGEVKFQFDGAPAPPAAPGQPPVVPTTGGTTLPNDEPYDSMFFKNYGVNPFIATDEDALSTFAVDVDAASYTIARRYLELGQLPPADAVRVEEFVNYFPQGYPHFTDDDFRILIEGAPSPFRPGCQLLRIGIKGRDIDAGERKSAELTFVIDVSGSMDREDRLGLVKRALRLLVDQMRDDDRIGIVVFGSSGRVLLEPVSLRDGRDEIRRAIDVLAPEGSTNTEEGLRLGYDMARRAYRPRAINRIVLCSDGVANVGRTGPESILATIRTEADRGIALSTIGFGMGNYNDVLMEQLADRGDGNHYYVDAIDEARRVFVGNLSGTLQTIARDAKVQVEFDSTRVLRYRLLGFENRDVADRDFRNDKVDAGEIGAGHEVTALYEVKLARDAAPGPLATVRLRYASPEHERAGASRVREIEQRVAVASLVPRFEDATPRFRLDAAVAQFAEILRGSYWVREARLADVLAVARHAARGVRDDASAEFVKLVEKAAVLTKAAAPGQEGGR